MFLAIASAAAVSTMPVAGWDPASVLQFTASVGLDALVVFLIAVAVDIAAGVVLAVRSGTFDLRQIPSFLASQFGTREFLVVATAVYVAWSTGGNLRSAALTVVTAGGSALTLALFADIWQKVSAIISGPSPK